MPLFESRKIFLNRLVSLLNGSTDEKQALCVSIDAGWGYGKTFFLDSLSSNLQKDGQITVCFNAWENDISDDAFIAFADSLISGLKNYLNDKAFLHKANDVIKAFGKATLKVVSDSIQAVEAGKEIIFDVKKELNSQKNSEIGFFQSGVKKTRLEEVKEKVNDSLSYFFENCNESVKGKKVYIFIDELDRCRPDFAIQVMERIKHFFSYPKLCFVFAINKSQLEKSIIHSFGDIDCGTYFEKFFDYSFALPESDVQEFLKTNIIFRGNSEQEFLFKILSQMILDSGINGLRMIERIVASFNTLCKMVPDFSTITKAEFLIPIAVFSKHADNYFFIEYFKNCDTDCYFRGTHESFKKSVYSKFMYYSNGKYEQPYNLLSDLNTDNGIRFYNTEGGYFYDQGRFLNLGKTAHVTIARREDIAKVYSFVASLS